MPPKKDAQAEKERTQKLLVVFGVIMLLVGLVNYKRIMKMFGGGKKKKGRTIVNRRSRGGARKGSTRGRRGRSGSSSVSPKDIPRLDAQVKKRLKNLRSRRPDIVPMSKLRYETVNPFFDLGVNRKDLDRRKRAHASGKGIVAPDALFFRGIMHVGENRYAIIERPDRKIPWYVKVGDTLEGTSFILDNIADDDGMITIMNPDAKRERDKMKPIPYSGLDKTRDLAKVIASVDKQAADAIKAVEKGDAFPGKKGSAKDEDDDMNELF